MCTLSEDYANTPWQQNSLRLKIEKEPKSNLHTQQTMQPWTASVNRGSPTGVYITVRHAYPQADGKPWLTMIGHPSSTGAHSTQSEQCLERIFCTGCTLQPTCTKQNFFISKSCRTIIAVLCKKLRVVTNVFELTRFMYGVDQLYLLHQALSFFVRKVDRQLQIEISYHNWAGNCKCLKLPDHDLLCLKIANDLKTTTVKWFALPCSRIL